MLVCAHDHLCATKVFKAASTIESLLALSAALIKLTVDVLTMCGRRALRTSRSRPYPSADFDSYGTVNNARLGSSRVRQGSVWQDVGIDHQAHGLVTTPASPRSAFRSRLLPHLGSLSAELTIAAADA
jgi:hypothetical protein